jgi:hypothetical protein
VTTVPPGTWSLAAASRRGRALGIIVVDGVLLRDVQLGGRRAMQLVGPGDVVLTSPTPSEALDVRVEWLAAVQTRIAVLDDGLQVPFAMWPGLALGLIESMGRQTARLAVHAAIAHLPRVDQRLEAMFWQLAERWGHVTPSGIHIPLALTHELLARLVGGRRPTISLALAELAERGVLLRRPDRTWLIIAGSVTLPDNGRDDRLPALEAQSPGPQTPAVTPAETWTPDAGRELIESVQRMRAGYMTQRRRLESDLERAAVLRRHSEELLEAIRERRRNAWSAPLSPPPD